MHHQLAVQYTLKTVILAELGGSKHVDVYIVSNAITADETNWHHSITILDIATRVVPFCSIY